MILINCSYVQLIMLEGRRNLVWTQTGLDLKAAVGNCKETGSQNWMAAL